MIDLKRVATIGSAAVGGLATAAFLGLSARFYLGRRDVERSWVADSPSRLPGVGAVERLQILPLVDWYAVREDLAREAGVSYLLRTEKSTVLFDAGLNERKEHPSPLLRNMDALGVSVGDIDAVVISHAHADHVGGLNNQLKGSFGLSGGPVDLRGVPAYAPVPLSNPTSPVTVVQGPRVVAPGVASMGTIPRQDFFLGRTLEQSLAINVAGRGLVLVVGCGHPMVQRIVERAETLFEEPVYGIVGGLHFPVTGSRLVTAGLPMQRILGTGKWPWDPVDRDEVAQAVAFLKRHGLRLVALSPHDSCDWSLDYFREAFGNACEDVLVGWEISVRQPSRAGEPPPTVGMVPANSPPQIGTPDEAASP